MSTVRLLARTTGVENTEYDNKSIDQLITGIARISSSRETNELFLEPEKLLRHCISNSHWSIFNQANLSFEVITSRAIGRELLRHWSLKPQEFCIDGNSNITVYTPDNTVKYITIKHLYDNKQQYLEQRYRVASLTANNTTSPVKLKDVFYNSVKPMYEVIFDKTYHPHTRKHKYNYKITCTKEHKFFTSDNVFKSLEDIVNLQLNDDLTVKSFSKKPLVCINSPSVEMTFYPVKSIKYVGLRDSYDLEVDNESHNYIANDIYVHNSQRYAEVTTFEDIELRLAGSSNRQSSTDVFDRVIFEVDKSTTALGEEVYTNIHATEKLYRELILSGIAKETARFILPETTQTKLVFNGSIREWITTLNQRLHKTAQKECRLVAEAMRDIFIKECPIISAALFNFEDAYDIHILDRVVLEKYGVYQMIKDNQFKKLK